MSQSINLNMPLPALIEELSQGDLKREIDTQFNHLLSVLAPSLSVKNRVLIDALLETLSEREHALRARINQLSSILLVSPMKEGGVPVGAQGQDLDNIAAFFGVFRVETSPGNSAVIPPIPPTYESDDALRKRISFALDQLSQAGVRGAYIFHFLSDPLMANVLQDVSVWSTNPGEVQISFLPQVQLLKAGDDAANLWEDGDYKPKEWVTDEIDKNVSRIASRIQCLTENFIGEPVTIKFYRVRIEFVFQGDISSQDKSKILQSARQQVETYVKENYLLGRSIITSYLQALLDDPLVEKIKVMEPKDNILCDFKSAPCCDFTIDKDEISYDIQVTEENKVS
jgi:phage-related baseplate assembly protein